MIIHRTNTGTVNETQEMQGTRGIFTRILENMLEESRECSKILWGMLEKILGMLGASHIS